MICAGVLLLLLHYLPIKAQALPDNSLAVNSLSGDLTIPLQPGEKIWSGVIKDGENLPYAVGSHFDFYANNRDNQIQPLLLGSDGLWVWSEEPYAFEVAADKLLSPTPRAR